MRAKYKTRRCQSSGADTQPFPTVADSTAGLTRLGMEGDVKVIDEVQQAVIPPSEREMYLQQAEAGGSQILG